LNFQLFVEGMDVLIVVTVIRVMVVVLVVGF
jgi:hypothetical protein